MIHDGRAGSLSGSSLSKRRTRRATQLAPERDELSRAPFSGQGSGLCSGSSAAS